MSKSPNKHNKIFMRVEALPNDILDMIRIGKIKEDMDKKEMAKILREKGWEADEQEVLAAIDVTGNMLIHKRKRCSVLAGVNGSILSGFDDVIRNGPIAHEAAKGVKFVLHHFVPHEDPAHRGLAQLMPATRRAMLGAMLIRRPCATRADTGYRDQMPTGLDRSGVKCSRARGANC